MALLIEGGSPKTVGIDMYLVLGKQTSLGGNTHTCLTPFEKYRRSYP